MDQAELSPEIRLMRLALGGIIDIGALAPDLAPLAAAHGPALDQIRALAEAHDHVGATTSASVAAHFDRLAASNPDLAVAAYSFGDAAKLAEFTAEVVEVAAAWTTIDGDMLDFGCGAGRVSAALVGRSASVTGIDVSTAMLAVARARVPGARFVESDGDTLPFADAAFDLVLAVDSFPFLVQTGAIHVQLVEIARMLRPGGRLLVFNWTYGDPADTRPQIEASPLALVRGPERPFRRWDATAFLLAHR